MIIRHVWPFYQGGAFQPKSQSKMTCNLSYLLLLLLLLLQKKERKKDNEAHRLDGDGVFFLLLFFLLRVYIIYRESERASESSKALRHSRATQTLAVVHNNHNWVCVEGKKKKKQQQQTKTKKQLPLFSFFPRDRDRKRVQTQTKHKKRDGRTYIVYHISYIIYHIDIHRSVGEPAEGSLTQFHPQSCFLQQNNNNNNSFICQHDCPLKKGH